MQVIVSLMKVNGGEIKWTYGLDFKYTEAPMIIDYQDSTGQGHHSLATKDVFSGGFTIAKLLINSNDATIINT